MVARSFGYSGGGSDSTISLSLFLKYLGALHGFCERVLPAAK
jgi:hypothetical protein